MPTHNADPTWTFWHGNALMADELEQWAAERAAQRCDECRFFRPIGGTRGSGKCVQDKLVTYPQAWNRCDAFQAQDEPVNLEMLLRQRWILEAR